jgi:hypothetical protein
MKNICIPFIVCALVLQSLSAFTQNGLFKTNIDGTGKVVKDNHGNKINVSEKNIAFIKAWIFSEDNANNSYSAFFLTKRRTNGDPWPVLKIDTFYFQPKSIGSDDSSSQIEFKLTDKEAKLISKKMKIKCTKRSNPGYKPKADFIPLKNSYFTGENISILFVLKNVGKTPFTFNHGGRYNNNSGRCNYFSFKILLKDSLQKDINNNIDGGGREGLPTLQRGESDTLKESISNWCQFNKPGIYTIECSYSLFLHKPHIFGDFEENMKYACYKWDKEVKKTIKIEVKAR